MRKNLQKLMLVGALVTTTAYASEMRTPWISFRGPLRYTFDKLNECGSNMNWWTAAHTKEANKAFLKHGFKTQELSALLFNKADFTLNEIFPDSVVPLDSPNYNPFVGITSISPRISYTEYGLTMGGSVDWPVWCNQGRIGLRVSVPFRRIEMERDDNPLDETENLPDFVKEANFKVKRQHDGVATPNTEVDVMVKAYRMDLLAALRNANMSPILVGKTAGMTIFNTQIGSAGAQTAPVAITRTEANNTPFHHAFQFSDGATVVADSAFAAADIRVLGADYVANLPTDNTTVARIDNGADYSLTLASDGFNTNKAQTWLIFRRQTNSPDPERFGAGVANQAGVGAGIADGIDNLLKQFNENVFTFLTKAGFSLDDQIRSGLGDIDLDLFYEHNFNDCWVGELAVGVRFPTGGGSDQGYNPFRPNLGNGEHFEIKLFGLMAWQVACWMNIKLDASYNFVLEATEERMAVFKGSQIKNFGPRADADVDWGYFIGHVDFNFIHPKTSKIRSMIGYEFYFKTEDHISFKSTTATTFLGTTGTLDSKLARKNTESIAHKVRGETSVDCNKYFEFFFGASFTFAGQNVMKDRDMHGGFNIRF